MISLTKLTPPLLQSHLQLTLLATLLSTSFVPPPTNTITLLAMAATTIDQTRSRYSQELADHTFRQWNLARQEAERRAAEAKAGQDDNNTTRERGSAPSGPSIKVVDFAARSSGGYIRTPVESH